MNDGGGQQTQAGGAEALVLERAVAELAFLSKNTARRSELLASPLFSPAWLR